MTAQKTRKRDEVWKRRRSPPFGYYIEVPMPPDCDMVLICADTVGGHQPIQICLPHQTYVREIKAAARKLDARSITIMPYPNSAKVCVDIAALSTPKRRAKT